MESNNPWEERIMSEAAFEKFIAPESAWIHDAIAVVEEVFGIQKVDADVDDGELVVTVTCDPVAA